MKNLYKVTLAVVVYARDSADAERYITENDPLDAFTVQEVEEIEHENDLPPYWEGTHCALDAARDYEDPWSDKSIVEILKKNKEEVHNLFEGVVLSELLQKYMELESRLLAIEEKKL